MCREREPDDPSLSRRVFEHIKAKIQYLAKRFTGAEIVDWRRILSTGNQLVWYYVCRGPLLGINLRLDPDPKTRANKWISFFVLAMLVLLIFLASDKRLQLGLLLVLFNPLWLYALPNIYDPLMENRAYTQAFAIGLIAAYLAEISFWPVVVLVLLWGLSTWQRSGYWATRYGFWKRACRESPSATRPRINWAVALSKNNQFDEAMDIYRGFVCTANDSFDAALGVANLSLMYLYLDKITNDHSWMRHATELLVYGVEVWPSHPRILFNRGCIFMGYQQWVEAIDEFDAAIRIFPSYTSAYRQRARCYGMLGDLKTAKEDGLRADAIDGRKAVVRLMRREGETEDQYQARVLRVQQEDPDVQALPLPN